MLADQSDGGEKRDFMRMTVDCKATFTEIESGQNDEGRVLNLSGTGVLFRTDRELKMGTQLELSVISENGSVPPLDAKVEVVRVEVMEPGVYEIGALIIEAR